MTSAQVLYDLNQTDVQYLISAHTIMTAPHTKRKRHLNIRFSLIAAAIVAIVMIPLTVIIANHYGITPPPIPVITTPEETYKSLTDIPGAVKVDPENGIVKDDWMKDFMPPHELIHQLKTKVSRVNFVGTAQLVESIVISSGKHRWTLMSFDVTVEKNIWNAEVGKTVRILTICYFTESESFNNILRHYLPDLGAWLLDNPHAFFSVHTDLFDDAISYKYEIPVDLSLYADYLDAEIFETDDEGFYYRGTKIDFSEIIPDASE